MTELASQMPEWRVEWVACPTSQNTKKVTFVQASNSEDAKKLVTDWIERKHGISWFKIESASESEAVPTGRIVEHKKRG